MNALLSVAQLEFELVLDQIFLKDSTGQEEFMVIWQSLHGCFEVFGNGKQIGCLFFLFEM